jgi:hypothetical protein
MDLSGGWPGSGDEAVYALANGGRYQIPAGKMSSWSLAPERDALDLDLTRSASKEFRDCLLNGLGRHLQRLCLQIDQPPLVADFVQAVQGGGLSSLLHLTLHCSGFGRDSTLWTVLLHSVGGSIPTLQRLDLQGTMGRCFEPSMSFSALQHLCLEYDDTAIAFADAARGGAFANLLHLECVDIGDPGCAAIARALKHTRVHFLGLEYSPAVTDASALLEDVDSLRRLTTLKLPWSTVWYPE